MLEDVELVRIRLDHARVAIAALIGPVHVDLRVEVGDLALEFVVHVVQVQVELIKLLHELLVVLEMIDVRVENVHELLKPDGLLLESGHVGDDVLRGRVLGLDELFGQVDDVRELGLLVAQSELHVLVK